MIFLEFATYRHVTRSFFWGEVHRYHLLPSLLLLRMSIIYTNDTNSCGESKAECLLLLVPRSNKSEFYEMCQAELCRICTYLTCFLSLFELSQTLIDFNIKEKWNNKIIKSIEISDAYISILNIFKITFQYVFQTKF